MLKVYLRALEGGIGRLTERVEAIHTCLRHEINERERRRERRNLWLFVIYIVAMALLSTAMIIHNVRHPSAAP